MRYAPGQSAELDAQMRAIAALRAEARLAWLEDGAPAADQASAIDPRNERTRVFQAWRERVP